MTRPVRHLELWGTSEDLDILSGARLATGTASGSPYTGTELKHKLGVLFCAQSGFFHTTVLSPEGFCVARFLPWVRLATCPKTTCSCLQSSCCFYKFYNVWPTPNIYNTVNILLLLWSYYFIDFKLCVKQCVLFSVWTRYIQICSVLSHLPLLPNKWIMYVRARVFMQAGC